MKIPFKVYRAPGRVNLIGEHTDYNDGFVMPIALDLFTSVAAGPREDRRLVIHSREFAETVELDLDRISRRQDGHWSNYVVGVASVLERSGYRLRGADLLLQTDLPVGSGLASSAALEVAVGRALLDISELVMDRTELALSCQRAEHEFAGTRCGIMDQFAACHGQPGQALMLDTRHLEFELFPLPDDIRVVVCNTMVKHSLATNEYNARRGECEAGVRLLSAYIPGLRALRDAGLEDLQRHRHEMPATVYRRCRHVIRENGRVLAASRVLAQRDFVALGRLMSESHRSLRHDYEVSCRELDIMVELACRLGGVYGARMTGGGFGGCTVSLVRADCAADFTTRIAEDYRSATGLAPEVYGSSRNQQAPARSVQSTR
jgi:galactokinase